MKTKLEVKNLKISEVTDQLVILLWNNPKKNNYEKAKSLGRSYVWFLQKAKNLGLHQPRIRRNPEEFYDFFDTIPYGSSRIMKNVARTTIQKYLRAYCKAQPEKVKYELQEVENGFAVKLYER